MKAQGDSQGVLFDVPSESRLREYSDVLTVDVNEKGVLDVDTVKGCTAGMSARPEHGCYDGCYAAKIAKFRGIDFSKAVTRTVHSRSQARVIERQVANSPQGFFRIGTMGDPCHAWEETVNTVEWLCDSLTCAPRCGKAFQCHHPSEFTLAFPSMS